MYEIKSKSDLQAGTTLIVRIPEEDLDKKALYTILAEQPGFVLPFRHRAIDGQIEFTYQIGNRSKLAYLSGSRNPVDYADLWFGLLQPLLDCGDWFMSPYSFVLEAEYLYCDKNGKSISYVYIPSKQACSDYDTLKSMVTDVANKNQATDRNLEIKALRAIQEFNPIEFLKMVNPYKANVPEDEPSAPKQIPVQSAPAPNHQPIQPIQPTPRQPLPNIADEPKSEIQKLPASPQNNSDDFAINFPPAGKTPKEIKAEKPKKEKTQPKPKDKNGFWGKKEPQQIEIIRGAGANPLNPAHEQPMNDNGFDTPTEEDYSGKTEIESEETDAPKFRYVGNGSHPRVIEVIIEENGIFTVGRFDVSLGFKQSDFEFEKKTKAVSRRHAVVERDMDGYKLIDLNSQAGTFINGQKLRPNIAAKLERGCRVSFGYSGADYVWEE